MCGNKSPQYTLHLFPNEKKCREVSWIWNTVLIVGIYIERQKYLIVPAILEHVFSYSADYNK